MTNIRSYKTARFYNRTFRGAFTFNYFWPEKIRFRRKKMSKFRCFGLSILAFTLVFNVLQIAAQESTSSASVSRSRALANSGNPGSYRRATTFVAPDEVAVEEFINYHRHRIQLPKVGQSVAVEARWGNDRFSSRDEAVLQIGFTTASANDRTDIRPLNLSLVIDKSGSMLESDKMSRVKESLRTMIGQLRPEDFVSIVVFDSTARVLCSSARVGNGRNLINAINSISSGGSTNLHEGLILGYREAQKNFEKDATNRVILLTDGIANVGITNPKTIAVESSEYNGQGIDLSTIGVGIDLDRELLRTLSKQGRGLFHFVADAHDIEKVFVKEVQSLISPVARDVELEVTFDSSLEISKVFGYEPQIAANRVTIPIDDMNSGLTQVVMFKLRKSGFSILRGTPVKVRLTYYDIATRKRVEDVQSVSFGAKRGSDELLVDSEVRKNYTIAELAQSLFDMTAVAKENDYKTAERILEQSIVIAYGRYPNMEDTDIRFVLDIVEDYRRNLREINGSENRDRDCGKCR